MPVPHTILGQTHFELEAGDVRFVVWARPVVSDGGRRVDPVTLLWRFQDGMAGSRACGGLIEATEYAARVTSAASIGYRLTS